MSTAGHNHVTVNIKNKLAVITLCRPEKKNAINTSMYEAVTKALEFISNNDEVTITVITGSGEFYCSGTDLQEALSQGTGASEDVLKTVSLRLRRFVEAFINHSKVLVAVVNGPAVGIAVTTLGLCDIVYSVDTATFHTPFTRLGMVAEGCSSYTFSRLMGSAKANEMLLFNRKFTAQEAFNAGLVSQLYTPEQINTILWPTLRQNAMELPLKSLQYSKQMIRKFDVAQLHEANRLECERLEERWMSEDCINAIITFRSRKSKL